MTTLLDHVGRTPLVQLRSIGRGLDFAQRFDTTPLDV